jgi:Raf kinase inhibitor-like YbhB/YbcL family protein
MSRNWHLALALVVLASSATFVRAASPGLAAESEHLTSQGGSSMSFAVKTTAFPAGGPIPKKYTCDGEDLSPALAWTNAPAGTQSFALIADDPDAPVGIFTHWILWNIPPDASGLPEGVPQQETVADGARQGKNGFRRIGYGGPCPPPGKPHRYFFKVYALGAKLDLKAGASRGELERAMGGHVLAEAQLMGTFGR